MESMFILQQKLPFVQAMKMGFELTSYQHFYGDKLLESMQQFMVKIRENEKERTHRFNVV